MPLRLLRQDITQMETDAIVNAANVDLQEGGGVCGAIFGAAGAVQLQKACDAIGHCETGKAVITPGFGLKAKYIIHTPGPVWRGGTRGEEALLRSCYRSSLDLAAANGLHSIAFPLISAGIYGYPPDQALQTAVDEIGIWLQQSDDDEDMDVTLLVFSRKGTLAGTRLYGEIRSYLDEHDLRLQEDPDGLRKRRKKERKYWEPDDDRVLSETQDILQNACPAPDTELTKCCLACSISDESLLETDHSEADEDRETAPNIRPSEGLNEFMKHPAGSFREELFRLIDSTGETDAQVYKRANLDRRLFSKIRSSDSYIPGKNTILALCLSLKLSLSQARDLLALAGYALSPALPRDRVIEYCLLSGEYNVFDVNACLYDFGLPTLNDVR